MKIRNYILFFALLSLFSCRDNIDTERNSKIEIKDNTSNSRFELPYVAALEANFPVQLHKIDFRNKESILHISDGKQSAIESVITDYYFQACGGDSTETYFSIKDVYLNTIQIAKKSTIILYWVILRHSTGKVNSKVLFYNNVSKEFLNPIFDFNIHALYNELDGQLTPTNLKKKLNMNNPEIELVDSDKDGRPAYKFTRLYHNGTSNAIEETIIQIENNRIDTLSFKQKGIHN